jgi:hypothetical protein
MKGLMTEQLGCLCEGMAKRLTCCILLVVYIVVLVMHGHKTIKLNLYLHLHVTGTKMPIRFVASTPPYADNRVKNTNKICCVYPSS